MTVTLEARTRHRAIRLKSAGSLVDRMVFAAVGLVQRRSPSYAKSIGLLLALALPLAMSTGARAGAVRRPTPPIRVGTGTPRRMLP